MPVSRIENLVIDDLTIFKVNAGSVRYARNSADGIRLLEEHAGEGCDNIWLDHDLGELEDGTVDDIIPVVEWLREKSLNGEPYRVGMVHVHTRNPAGRKVMMSILDRAGLRYRNVDSSQFFEYLTPDDARLLD